MAREKTLMEENLKNLALISKNMQNKQYEEQIAKQRANGYNDAEQLSEPKIISSEKAGSHHE